MRGEGFLLFGYFRKSCANRQSISFSAGSCSVETSTPLKLRLLCTSACTYGCSHLQQTFTETFLPLTCSKTLQKTRRTEANSCLKERLLLKEDHRTEEELSWGGGGSCPQAGAFSASQNCRLMQFAKQRSYETGYFDTTC